MWLNSTQHCWKPCKSRRRSSLWRPVILHFSKPLDQISELVRNQSIFYFIKVEQIELDRKAVSDMWSWMTMSNQRKETQNYKVNQRIIFKLKLTLTESFCYPSLSKTFPLLEYIDGNSRVKPLKNWLNKSGKDLLVILF